MALTTKLQLDLSCLHTNALDLGSASFPFNRTLSRSLGSGTGAGNADRLWTDQRTLSASASEDLDLAGSLTDAFGASVSFARVKLLYIAAAAANSNNVVVGGAASNGFATMFSDASDELVLRPGAVVLLAAGVADATCYAVTASTGDLLTVANSGAGSPVTYDIAIIGASA